jgi:RNA polymerase sigma-70 factor (ECF subfamily)
MELEEVAPAAVVEVRETEFIERLKRGEASAFEELIAERSGEIYGLLFRLTEVALRAGLQQIGRAYRETVILRDIEGFAYEEIATTLGINIGTVKSRLARGRQELRQKLEGSL